MVSETASVASSGSKVFGSAARVKRSCEAGCACRQAARATARMKTLSHFMSDWGWCLIWGGLLTDTARSVTDLSIRVWHSITSCTRALIPGPILFLCGALPRPRFFQHYRYHGGTYSQRWSFPHKAKRRLPPRVPRLPAVLRRHAPWQNGIDCSQFLV